MTTHHPGQHHGNDPASRARVVVMMPPAESSPMAHAPLTLYGDRYQYSPDPPHELTVYRNEQVVGTFDAALGAYTADAHVAG